MLGAWHTEEVSDILHALKASENGLSTEEASRRLKESGPNSLPEAKSESIALLFVRQFKSSLIYVLLGASAVMFLMGESVDALIILAVLLFNAIVGAIQEGRAQNTLRALKHFVETNATVMRGNVETIIPDTEVVEGDSIILQEGEKVPADARLMLSHSLRVDEAALTGESEPVTKTAAVLSKIDLPITDQDNMLFKGTYVVAGNGKAVVVATGERTVIGKIAEEISSSAVEIPLAANIRSLSHLIIGAVLAICVVLFFYGLAVGYSISLMFGTAVAIAVSAIPEGLPIVLTLVLATGVWRMGKRNALVKRLPAVEALGQARVIAVDKTGTLTKNEIIVEKLYIHGEANGKGDLFDISGVGYAPEGNASIGGTNTTPEMHHGLARAGRIAALSANARVLYSEELSRWRVTGDPTEAALLVFAQKLGLSKEDIERGSPLIAELPFDSAVKYHALVHRDGRELFLSVVGAPEVILSMCNASLQNGEHKHLSETERAKIEEQFLRLSEMGLRVVALAEKRHIKETLAAEDVGALTFVALVGMKDGLRPEVPDAMRRAIAAGIRVVMITGDHAVTARAIGKEAGIFQEGDAVLTGEEMNALSDNQLSQRIGKVSVFARMTPEHKLRIIKAYRLRGEIIAMTGDGVNDAPSLVAADLGVAMGGIGTEVAKEASDIILLDDNFGSIVSAVEEGRSIYKTLKKVILYLFSTNIGEVLVITGALILTLPLPLLPSQIIWLNFVTDGFLTAALAMEPKEKGLLTKTFERPKKYLIDGLMTRRMVLMAITMAIGTLGLFVFYVDDIAKALTVSLTALAVFQWFNAWNVRSETESVFTMNPFSNLFLVGATLIVVVLQVLAVYTSFLQGVLHTVPISLSEWALIVGVAFSIVIVEEVRKIFARQRAL